MSKKIDRLTSVIIRLFSKVCSWWTVPSAWKDWYRTKEGSVEEEIPKLEELFRSCGVQRILDFGCGAGRHTIYFAERGFEVYGFDQSSTAVEDLSSKLARKNVPAHLRAWNMLTPLPYDTGFFDAVIALRVIHHAYKKNIENITGEIRRVLRDNGFIFIQVPSYDNEMKSLMGKRNPRWVESGTVIPLRGFERGIPQHFFKKEELLTLLAGYKILDIHSETAHYGGYCIIAKKTQTLT